MTNYKKKTICPGCKQPTILKRMYAWMAPESLWVVDRFYCKKCNAILVKYKDKWAVIDDGNSL